MWTLISVHWELYPVYYCRVIVMEEGSIVETGHPNILLRDSSARFSRFVASQ